jgi:uridine kinase
MHEKYIEPTKIFADSIIENQHNTEIKIEKLIKKIKSLSK